MHLLPRVLALREGEEQLLQIELLHAKFVQLDAGGERDMPDLGGVDVAQPQGGGVAPLRGEAGLRKRAGELVGLGGAHHGGVGAGSELGDGAGADELTPIEDDDPLGDLLHLVELVTGDQDGAAFGGKRSEEAA